MYLTLEFEIKFLEKSQLSNSLELHLMKILLLMTIQKNVTTKISKSIGVMRRLHHQLPADVMVKLYYSLVYSHLTYPLLAWGRSGRMNAAKIECAHRRARKLLTDYNHRILTCHSIYDYVALLTAFNTNFHNFHQYFKDKLSSHQPSQMHNTRHRTNSNFNTPHSKTQKCYLYQVIPIWNSPPNSIKNCTSKLTFKKQIKSRLLASQSLQFLNYIVIYFSLVWFSLAFRFTTASVFLPYRAEFSLCTCSRTVGKKEVSFRMTIGNEELMHECFPKHLCMEAARMK